MKSKVDNPSNAANSPVWLVRAGANGEDEVAALEQNLAIIGFTEFPDMTDVADADALLAGVRQANPEAPERRIRNWVFQMVAFALRMCQGDMVALPLKTRPGRVALGRVTGSYTYRKIEGVNRHTRPVEWIRTDVSRSDLGQDLLYSLGALMTVCRIQRNEAERRFNFVLAGKPDPGSDTPADGSGAIGIDEETIRDDRVILNIAELAHQQILDHIRSRFTGHDLARLVDAVLRAEGYTTRLSPPGPDGGVDILAGRGSLAFEGPRICVQVKASTGPTDVTVFRSLKGTMQTFQATQGLLVSWGGFTRSLEREAKQDFFAVRLWHAGDLVSAIYRTYENLPEQIQAEIPLERVWMLVHDKDDR